MKKKLMFVAMAALALVGCNDKTQSELTDEMVGLSGEAKIEVSFYYNQGKHEVDGVAFEGNEYVPATVEVIATVDYSAYSNQEKDKVFKQFKATRTGEGTYTLTIPAGEKKITAKVAPKGFVAKYWKTLTESVDAYYELPANKAGERVIEFEVIAGNSYVKKDPKETTMAITSEALNNNATVEFGVSGKVTAKEEELEEKDSQKTHKTREKKMGSVDIELEISNTDKDSEGNLKDERKLTYKTTTNSEGEYNTTVKIFNGWDFSKVEISVKPLAKNDKLKHYYEELNVESTQGLYEDNHNVTIDAETVNVKGWASVTTGKRDWKNTEIDGYWKGEASKITLSNEKVELAKKESDHNLTMTFVPLQPKKVPGITEGEEYKFKACNYADREKETKTYYEHTVKQYSKTAEGIITALGWGDYVK